MENEGFKLIGNIGKTSAIMDILSTMYYSYEEGSKAQDEIKACMNRIEEMTKILVADYNEKQNKN